MKCENCFCLYQSKGKCTLEEIEMDIIGICSDLCMSIYPKTI